MPDGRKIEGMAGGHAAGLTLRALTLLSIGGGLRLSRP